MKKPHTTHSFSLAILIGRIVAALIVFGISEFVSYLVSRPDFPKNYVQVGNFFAGCLFLIALLSSLSIAVGFYQYGRRNSNEKTDEPSDILIETAHVLPGPNLSSTGGTVQDFPSVRSRLSDHAS